MYYSLLLIRNINEDVSYVKNDEYDEKNENTLIYGEDSINSLLTFFIILVAYSNANDNDFMNLYSLSIISILYY